MVAGFRSCSSCPSEFSPSPYGCGQRNRPWAQPRNLRSTIPSSPLVLGRRVFLVTLLGELRWADRSSVMVRIDLGSIHCGPSVPPSVSIVPPSMAMDHRPCVDSVGLEKNASRGSICADRRRSPPVRDKVFHGPGISRDTGGSNQHV